MAKAVRAGVLVVAALALVAAGVFVRDLPDRALERVKDALASGDEAALAAYIDFDALRESLKRQLLESFTAAAPDARVAMAASRFVSPLVEGIVTPTSLAELAAGKGLSGDVDAVWRGLDGAEVLVENPDGTKSRWLLARRGLSFVLVGVELPRALTRELERQWSARLVEGVPATPEDDALIDESRARACAAWRKNALGALQAITQAQRAHHARHARYADDVAALEVPPLRGPDLYDFRVRRADDEGFTLEARGKGLMAGDVLEADEAGIRVLRDLCASLPQR